MNGHHIVKVLLGGPHPDGYPEALKRDCSQNHSSVFMSD